MFDGSDSLSVQCAVEKAQEVGEGEFGILLEYLLYLCLGVGVGDTSDVFVEVEAVVQ